MRGCGTDVFSVPAAGDAARWRGAGGGTLPLPGCLARVAAVLHTLGLFISPSWLPASRRQQRAAMLSCATSLAGPQTTCLAAQRGGPNKRSKSADTQQQQAAEEEAIRRRLRRQPLVLTMHTRERMQDRCGGLMAIDTGLMHVLHVLFEQSACPGKATQGAPKDAGDRLPTPQAGVDRRH